MVRPLLRPLAIALTVAAAVACRAVGDYLDYRDLAAHERRYDALRVDRLALEVDVAPGEARLEVRARLGLVNEGTAALQRIELLANPALALRGVESGGRALEARTADLAIGELALRRIDVALQPPLRAGGRIELELDYGLAFSGAQDGARLRAREGWVRAEALWVPVVHTILSRHGMDRAPCELSIALPDGLVPVGLGDFARAADDGGGMRWVARSDFPFQPFFAYGAYRERALSDAADAPVAWALADAPADDTALATWLDAARTARRYLERSLGERPLGRTKLVLVEGMSGAWGAPFCVLIDADMLSVDREEALWVLGHELAHTWWGDSVAIGGSAGYVHEGLANALALFLLGEVLGPEVEPRYRALLLRRFCAPETPLAKPLDELTVVDPDYERGAYDLGGLFWCALDERLGRARFLGDLAAFAAAYDERAADLDALERFLVEQRGAPVADLFDRWARGLEQADLLYARRPELLADAAAAWSAADTTIDPGQRAAAEAELATVVAELRAALAEVEGTGAEPWARVRERWNNLRLADPAQVTVIDREGRYRFHVQDLSGDALWYRDVRGESVYGRMLASDAPRGSFVYYGFLERLGESARRTSVFWTALEERPWIVVLEVHRRVWRR